MPAPIGDTAHEAIRAFIVYKGASQGEVVTRLKELGERAVRVEPQNAADRGRIRNIDNNIQIVRFP
jgi:hypothetical protein